MPRPALDQTQKLSREMDQLQGAGQHAIWAAAMTRDMGARQAKKFGDLHENVPQEPGNQRYMDLFNNAVGRAVGAHNSWDATVSILLKMARSTELMQLVPGDDARSGATYNRGY
jgi:hypothetical protein